MILLLHPSRFLLAIMIDKMMQVNGVLKKKTLKENTTPAALGAHGLKPSKPKSTNPKPFRLRTDVCYLSLIHHQDYWFIVSLHIANLISIGWWV